MAAAGKGRGKAKAGPGAKRRLRDEEPDPVWRVWFQEVERRRRAQTDIKFRPVRPIVVEKDGVVKTSFRARAEPTPLGRFIKQNRKKAGSRLAEDFQCIRDQWRMAVGDAIAGDTAVHSFKNGVLTVNVFSSSLLQEIRQFHQDAILSDLQDVWKASVPLVRLIFRLGKR